jgi:ureidoglycolate lyase
MQIRVEPLTAEAFAPFGAIVEAPASAPQASGPGWQWWGETALMEGDSRPYGIGYLRIEPAAPRFDWAERHMRSPEMIVPLAGACLVYVGPAEYPQRPDQLPELDHFRVFEVRAGQAVILNPGVWHGAPLAVGSPLSAIVLLKQGTGTTDVTVVRFEDRPVEIVMT